MSNSYFFEIDIPIVVAFISAIITLLLQILLCFKVKRTWVKILPAALLAVLTIGFYICAVRIGGWDAFGYLFFALLSCLLVLVCGIGWGIWAIVRKRT